MTFVNSIAITVLHQTSTSLPWELDERSTHLTPPPPQKRIKSADLYRAQHGISPDRADVSLKEMQPILAAAAAYHTRAERGRNRSKENNRSRDSSSLDREGNSELRDSLLGQALEAGTTLSVASVVFSFKFWL